MDITVYLTSTSNNRHLDDFQSFTITSSAAVSILVVPVVGTRVSRSVGQIPRNERTGPKDMYFFHFNKYLMGTFLKSSE